MYPDGSLGLQLDPRLADTEGMKSADTPARLVGYVRVSTEEQARDGLSLDAQRARLAAYAEAHRAELVAVEADNGRGPPDHQGVVRRHARGQLHRYEADDVDDRPGRRPVLQPEPVPR